MPFCLPKSTCKKIVLVILIAVCLPYFIAAQSGLKPGALTCEYMENPLGIDAAHPRLHWKLSDSRAGALQSASEVVVSKDSAEVSRTKGTEWQTQKVASGSQLISYQGRPLQPFTK